MRVASQLTRSGTLPEPGRRPTSADAGPGRPVDALAAVFLLLALCAAGRDAGAAGLGSVSPTVGVFAALTALLVVKSWPAASLVSVPTAFGALALLAGAGWFFRTPLARMAGARLGLDTAVRAPTKRAKKRMADVCLPPGVDAARLREGFRVHFLAVQTAWDLGDLKALGDLTTPDMLDELLRQKHACRERGDASEGRTEIVTLAADLVGLAEVPQARIASVQFSGLMRHACDAPGTPFNELWLLTQSDAAGDAGRWRLARHQVLL